MIFAQINMSYHVARSTPHMHKKLHAPIRPYGIGVMRPWSGKICTDDVVGIAITNVMFTKIDPMQHLRFKWVELTSAPQCIIRKCPLFLLTFLDWRLSKNTKYELAVMMASRYGPQNVQRFPDFSKEIANRRENERLNKDPKSGKSVLYLHSAVQL